MAGSWTLSAQLTRTAGRLVGYGSPMKLRHLAQVAAGIATVTVAAGGAVVLPGDEPAVISSPAPAVQVTKTPTAIGSSRSMCKLPAPTSAAGFRDLFAKVDIAEFGAADVGLSVPLADGRSVWLWGDTMSWTRFVHSSGIVQDRGCLHVSRRGGQVLPDDYRINAGVKSFYWIESARELRAGVLEVTAEEIVKTGTGVWDFKHTGFNRRAEVTVDRAGDLSFVRWTGRYAVEQAAQFGDLVRLDSGQLSYSPRLHPEFKLTSGLTLKTAARNWDDGAKHPIETYRVVFEEVTNRP